MAISMVKKSARQNDFACAMYRDELKGREGCNPDIKYRAKGQSIKSTLAQSLMMPTQSILDLA